MDNARLRIDRGKFVSVEKSWTWINRDRGKDVKCPWIGLGKLDGAWLLDGHAATIARTQKAYLDKE